MTIPRCLRLGPALGQLKHQAKSVRPVASHDDPRLIAASLGTPNVLAMRVGADTRANGRPPRHLPLSALPPAIEAAAWPQPSAKKSNGCFKACDLRSPLRPRQGRTLRPRAERGKSGRALRCSFSAPRPRLRRRRAQSDQGISPEPRKRPASVVFANARFHTEWTRKAGCDGLQGNSRAQWQRQH